MMAHRVKIGFAPTRRRIFSVEDALRYKALIAEKLRALEIEFVDRAAAKSAGISPYEYILREAGNCPSPLLVLPYFNGSGTPACDLEAKGIIAGLTLSSTRHEIARAILEALGFEMLLNLEAMQRAGIAIKELRCVGGGARSSPGLQHKADITGLPVHTMRVREAACFGAAMLAGVGVGPFADTAEAAGLARPDRSWAPETAVSKHYSEEVCALAAIIRRKQGYAAPVVTR